MTNFIHIGKFDKWYQCCGEINPRRVSMLFKVEDLPKNAKDMFEGKEDILDKFPYYARIDGDRVLIGKETADEIIALWARDKDGMKI